MLSFPLKKVLGAFACVATATLIACNNGTPLPPGVSAGGAGTAPSQTAGALAPLNINVAGFVGGEAAGSTSLSMSEKSTSRKNSPSGTLAGANGLDLKDAAWNNLFSSGLSVTPLPAGSSPSLRFRAAGSADALNSLNVGPSGLFDTKFDARTLRTGTNLILEMTVGGIVSEIMLPVLTIDDGDRIGFNAIRRLDGSLVVELFVDGVNNDTGALTPDGKSDNGLRVIVDNGFDINGDGVRDTVARMDSLDGLSVFDLNLDGRFGDPNDDGMIYLDTNGDGFADTPYHLASQSQRDLSPSPFSRPFVIDPELDGVTSSDAERDGSAAGYIESSTLSIAPEELSANGVNTATMRVEVRPSNKGLPFGSALSLELDRVGGETLPSATIGEARFLSNGAAYTTRVLDTSDPAVRLFFNGKMVLTETFAAPLLAVESVDANTHLKAEVEFEGKTEETENPLHHERTITLTPSMAPLLSNVSFTGQNSISGVTGGLDVLSRHARLVWGDVVRVNGRNFATLSSANKVTIGGVQANDVVVNAAGTQLDFTIPAGATTGPVSVVVGGFGGKSSESLVIAGQPFEVESITPSGAMVPTNAVFSIRMSRPVDASSIDGAVRLLDASDEDLYWNAQLADDGRTITLESYESGPMDEGENYRIVIDSGLQAADGDPAVHFDPIRNTPLADSTESLDVATFIAMAPDETAPTLVTSIPSEGAIGVNIRAEIALIFSEPMSAASIAGAVSSEYLELLNTDSFDAVPFTWSLSADRTTLTISPSERLAGNAPYTLQIPTAGSNFAPTDGSGNAFEIPLENQATYYTLTFTTGVGVEDMQPRSGPVGTVVTVTGGNFASEAPTVTVGGVSAAVNVIDQYTMEVTVPDGGTSYRGGPMVVTVGEQSTTAPTDFTVTLRLRTVDMQGIAGSQPIGLALSRDDRRVFVSNQGNGTISAYDLDTFAMLDADGNAANGVGPLVVGRVPSEAILSRDGRFLLTLDFGTQDLPGNSFFVVKVGEQGGRMGVETSVGVGMRPTRIAVSPDGSRWYVTNNVSNTVSVISAEAPFSVVTQIPTGDGPNGVTISGDGRRGYVCNFFEGTVTVFDTASNEAIGNVAVGAGPARAILSPNGQFVLVSCFGDNTIHILDAVNNSNVGSVEVLPEPTAMAFNRDGSQLFITSRLNDVVARYGFTVDEAGAPVLTENALIATARTPSGVAVTSDGSRLIVVNEGAGFPQVIFLETPTQTIEHVNRISGPETTMADRGEVIVIHGKGFANDPAINRVLFNGAEGLVDVDASNREMITVRVPDAATSGTLTVVIGDKESSPVSFVISPRIPKVVATTPSAGSLNVATNAEITLKFNEPVLGTANDILLERMLDTFTGGVRDLDQTPISGSVRTSDFGREVIFTPSAPLTETVGSNNLYRVTVLSSVRDYAGNRLEGDTVFTFRLIDSRGPTLLAATYIDVDNNGVDADDIVTLVFDERVSAVGLPAVIGSNGSNVNFSDASTFGVGATFELPNLALLGRTSAPNELAALNRTIMVRLGAMPSLRVPGMRTAITGLTNFTALAAIQDRAGNTALSLGQPSIDIGIALASAGSPRVLSVVLLNDDGDGIAQAGETIALYCSQPLTLINPLSPSDFVLTGAGASFGVSPTINTDPTNQRVIRITLGAGALFDFNDASSGTPTYSLTSPTPITSAVSFLDIPLQAWSMPVYSIGKSINGPRIATSGSPVVFRDLDNNGPDAGDVIEVRFDSEVTVGSAPANICFTLPVVGNSFGNNAFVRASQNPALSAQERARTVDIVLGANAKIWPAGIFSPSNIGFGAASGIDVSPTIPNWAIADVFGNSAQPNLTQASDIGSDDVNAPSLIGAVYVDDNKSTNIDKGDSIILVFDETLRRNGVLPSHFRIEVQGSQVFSLGSGASLTFGPNRPVNGMTIQGNTLRLTLGSGTDLFATDGVDVVVAAGNPIQDVSGNQVAAETRTPLDLNLPEVPRPILAVFNDEDANGQASSGDRIWVKFSRTVSLGATDPSLAFDLINITADFGAGAFMSIATVDAALIATGMTPFSAGVQDRQIVEITLGASPSLPMIDGIAPKFTFNYAGGGKGGNAESVPVGIAIKPSNGIFVSAQDLQAAFANAAATGRTGVFDGVTFAISGTALDNITIDLQLPGSAPTFLPVASHFNQLVLVLNDTFKRDGWNYRAFYNEPFNQLIITPSNPFWNVSSMIVSGPDVATPISASAFSGGNTGAITSAGVPAVTPRGSTDLVRNVGGIPGGSATLLSFAELNFANNTLNLFFDANVSGNTSYPVASVFELPVSGDSFGSGASWAFSGAGGVTITLGSGAILNEAGEFDNGLLSGGSPSGIRVRADAPADSIVGPGGKRAASNPVDLFGLSEVGPGPAMVSAVWNVDTGTIRVTFDQDVIYSPSTPLLDLFSLPVAGDSFGDSGAQLVSPGAANQVLILLGANPSFTATGVFDVGLLSSGSPSGLAIAFGANETHLTNTSLVGPQQGSVDLESIGELPAEVNIAMSSTGALDIPLGFNAHAIVRLDFTSTSSEEALIDFLSFDVTTTMPFNINQLGSRWRLFHDDNASGSFDGGDTQVAIGEASSTSVDFQSPALYGVSDSQSQTLFLVMDAAANQAMTQASFQLNLSGFSAIDALSYNSVSTTGAPASGPILNYHDTGALGLTAPAGQASVTGAAIDGGAALWGRAAASTNGAPGTFGSGSILTPTQISAATVSDIAGTTIDVKLQGAASPSHILTMAASPALTSGADKAHAIMRALREIPDVEGFYGAIIDANGNLVLRSHFEGAEIVLTIGGGVVTQVSGSSFTRADDSVWEKDHYAVFFGGTDGSTVTDALDIFREDGITGSLEKITPPVLADPIEGTPTARMDASMTIDENGIIYLYGGRNATNSVYGDVWALTPVFGPDEVGQESNGAVFSTLQALRWNKLNNGSNSRSAASLTYVAGSAAFSNAGLIRFGGRDGSNNITSDAEFFDLKAKAWAMLAPVSVTPSGLHTHLAGYEPLADALIIVGGATSVSGSTQSKEVFVLHLISGGNYELSTFTPIGRAPRALFRAAGVYEQGDNEFALIGGEDDNQNISGEVTVLRIHPDLNTGNWLNLVEPTDASAQTRRAQANLAHFDDITVLAYGRSDATTGLSDLTPVDIGGFAGNDDEIGPVMAVLKPIQSGTADIDAGETLTILFDGETNLMDLYPSGAMSEPEINSHINVADTPFPAGSTAVITSQQFYADTLTITFGGLFVLSQSSVVDFTPNLTATFPIESGNNPVETSVAIVGTGDFARFYEWDGVNSNFFDGDNWVGGQVPDQDDVAYFPLGSTPCFINDGDGSSQPPAVQLGQIIVHGTSLTSIREIALGGSTGASEIATLAVMYGVADLADLSIDVFGKNGQVLASGVVSVANLVGTDSSSSVNPDILLAGTLSVHGALNIGGGSMLPAQVLPKWTPATINLYATGSTSHQFSAHLKSVDIRGGSVTWNGGEMNVDSLVCDAASVTLNMSTLVQLGSTFHVSASTTFANSGATMVLLGGCTDILVPSLVGSATNKFSFLGYNQSISNGFESGLGSVTAIGTISIEGNNSGRGGIGSALKSEGSSDEVQVLAQQLPRALEQAALRFSIRATDPTTTAFVNVVESYSNRTVGAKYLFGSNDFDDMRPGVWKEVTVPFYISESGGMIDIRININNGSGPTYIDNLEVISWYQIRNSAPQNAFNFTAGPSFALKYGVLDFTHLHGAFNLDSDLAQAVNSTTVGSSILLGEDSTLAISNTETWPQALSVEFHAEHGNPSSLTWDNGVSSATLKGSVSGRNWEYTPLFTGKVLNLALGANFIMEGGEVHGGQLKVADSDPSLGGGRAAGLYLNNVTFDGTPSQSLNNANLDTYLAMGETGALVAGYAVINNVTFPTSNTAIGLISSEDTALTTPFAIGSMNAAFATHFEDDPQSASGSEDVSGNVIWNLGNYASVEYVNADGSFFDKTINLTPGANNVALVGIKITPKTQPYTFSLLNLLINSNVDDALNPVMTNVAFRLDDGDGVFSNTSDATVVGSEPVAAIDNPSVHPTLSQQTINTTTTYWVVVNVEAYAVVGTLLSLDVSLPLGEATYPNSLLPYFSEYTSFRVGSAGEATINDAWINMRGNMASYESTDSIIIQGANLGDAVSVVVEFDSGSTPIPTEGTPIVSPDGRFITGITAQGLPFGGEAKIRVTLTMPSGPPRTFLLSTEFLNYQY